MLVLQIFAVRSDSTPISIAYKEWYVHGRIAAFLYSITFIATVISAIALKYRFLETLTEMSHVLTSMGQLTPKARAHQHGSRLRSEDHQACRESNHM